MPNAKYFKYDEEYNLLPIYDDSVVEVVRCRDCKYSVRIGERYFCDLQDKNEWGQPNAVVKPDGYCDRGKRRETK